MQACFYAQNTSPETMTSYFTFREALYGIEFIIEHSCPLKLWEAEYVAGRIIEERKMLLFKAWRCGQRIKCSTSMKP